MFFVLRNHALHWNWFPRQKLLQYAHPEKWADRNVCPTLVFHGYPRKWAGRNVCPTLAFHGYPRKWADRNVCPTPVSRAWSAQSCTPREYLPTFFYPVNVKICMVYTI